MTISGYQLRVVTPPAVEPVTLEEIRRQCRIDSDITEEDEDLLEWVATARELAEDYTGRSFVERVLECRFSAFPWVWPSSDVVLPQGPVIEILSIAYYNAIGELTQMVEGTDYQLALGEEPSRIYPAVENTGVWPAAQERRDAVTVTYRAGYASAGSPTDAENVPKKAKQAIKMLAAHFFENRESVIVSERRAVPLEVPYSFERVLDPLRYLG